MRYAEPPWDSMSCSPASGRAAYLGLGAPGEVRQGPDGLLYGWIPAAHVSGRLSGFWAPLGEVGFFKRLRRAFRRARRFVGRAARGAMRLATHATPLARRLLPMTGKLSRFLPIPGAQFISPALTMAQRAGLFGLGQPGEQRMGPDGFLYEWVGAVDGLGRAGGGLWARRVWISVPAVIRSGRRSSSRGSAGGSQAGEARRRRFGARRWRR